jgi:hypothetical protein
LFAGRPVQAQTGIARTTSVQVRLGAFMATTLIDDAVSSRALDDSIPGVRSNSIQLKQKPGPIGTVALRVPLRATTQLEVSASAARSLVRGDDELESWDVANVTIGNFVIGFGYLYRNTVAMHAGVGLTRLFAEERALFSKGNSIKPLVEAGLSSSLGVAGVPIDLDLRVQSHSYGTAALRDSGGADGSVMRGVLQIGTTLWKAGSK